MDHDYKLIVLINANFEMQGILSPVQLDGITLHHWKMYPLSLNALDNLPKLQLISQLPNVRASKVSVHGDSKKKLQELSLYSNGKSL
jgi:beta-galactosidase